MRPFGSSYLCSNIIILFSIKQIVSMLKHEKIQYFYDERKRFDIFFFKSFKI